MNHFRHGNFVLSIYPTSRGFGFVLFESSESPFDWGVKEIREKHTNKRTINEVFAGRPGDLTRYPLWVASYKTNPPPTMPAGWTDWKIWQYTDNGTCLLYTSDAADE